MDPNDPSVRDVLASLQADDEVNSVVMFLSSRSMFTAFNWRHPAQPSNYIVAGSGIQGKNEDQSGKDKSK